MYKKFLDFIKNKDVNEGTNDGVFHGVNEEFAYHSSEKPIDNFLPLNKYNQNKSGYYNGVYFFLNKNNAFEFNKKGFIYKINIDNLKLYNLIDGDLLKKKAKEAGFFINQGSGYNETVYLKQIGFDGIKRGNEIIIFEPEKLKIEGINEGINEGITNPNFKKWFKDSKVVDKNGNPLVVYHATNGDFDEFKPESSAYYFAENSQYACNVTHGNIVVKRGQNIMPVYLSIQNPKEVSFPINHQNVDRYLNSYDYLKELPDGLVGFDFNSREKVWVVFKQNQIKSATGNNGNFNSNSNIINENKHFPLELEKWKEYYDIFMKEFPDNSYRDKALDILYTIKRNNYRITEFQYNYLKQTVKNKDFKPDEYITDILPNISLEPLKKEKFFTTIPFSTIDNYYMVMIKSLKQKDYNFFVKLLTNIKNRYIKNNKTDNKADVTEREFQHLKNLKTGNIEPKNYSSKN